MSSTYVLSFFFCQTYVCSSNGYIDVVLVCLQHL
ncbi:hypothetical protein T01_15183 [Trichinella spiralis]|uniref:Uncharacterized protein n=1 Tax=Trichinella spiralis TaxID=6334 RepID=A0A0V1AL78_TRISP|nr:hypothetical protein T01_8330 [Trichinella spiralis]KRY25574.1 hypothetical protein T01_15183 [Trichinella spiralis]